MERKIYGIFTAGGTGSRMGSDTPKQFLLLGGIPILQRTIETFVRTVPQMQVVTVLPRPRIAEWKQLCLRYECTCPQVMVAGGITRFHSVRNALRKIPDGALVLIHDGVRPLVSPALIRRALDEASGSRAVIPVMPVVDALRSLDPSHPDPDRSAVVAVQTPQVFRSEDIKAAYEATAYDTSILDDGAVAAGKGIPLSFIEGERYNIKITSPEDLVLAEAILALNK